MRLQRTGNVSVSVSRVSYSDLLVQDLLRYGSDYDLRQHSIRIVRSYANDIHVKYHGIRTCHSCWDFLISPGNELDLECDNGSRHRVRETDITVIPPWLPFRHWPARRAGWHCYILCALVHLPDTVAQQLFPGIQRIRDPAIVTRFLQLNQQLQTADGLPPLLRALHGQDIASRCFLALLEQLDTDARQVFIEPNKARLRIQPALDFIQKYLHTSISIEHLAKRLDLSADHFTRLFKKHLQQTPVQYIISQRVSRAAELLYGSELKLDDIAELCGFPNRRYLSRRFNEHFGMSPSDFRNSHS